MTAAPSRRRLFRYAAAGTAATWVSGTPDAAARVLPAPAAPLADEPLASGLPAGSPDSVVFGDTASEKAHALTGDETKVVDGAGGSSARVAQPRNGESTMLGELRFTMKVDPARQNYLTLKFWGEDSSKYKTVVLVNGEAVNYRDHGDYETINTGTQGGLHGRFFFATTMLPLVVTAGQSVAEITLRTYHNSLEGTATEESRKYYAAYTHTTPLFGVADGELPAYTKMPQAAPGLSRAEEQKLVDSYRAHQISVFNTLSRKADASPTATMSIERYKDELRFYAEALSCDWCPAQSDAEKKRALERIFQSIDTFTRQFYGDVKSLGTGGHQSDWGGYYGALGEALYIVENLIADDAVYGADAFRDFLRQPFKTGTTDGANSIAGTGWDGGELTRFGAWERLLKANFDFARSRLSYIYNQVMYTYEGAWKAHEGLRVIGSRFYEGRERSHAIAGEALGFRPFLGEEVLAGPKGEELDLYHSLFQHDDAARYTDDYLQVVMRGLAKSKRDGDGNVVRRLPYGRHYTGLTPAGLTRENHYVGNYGEAANYLAVWFHRTLDHAGDEPLNRDILKAALKSVHARGMTRYQGVDAEGARIMYMQQVTDDRNSAYPGKLAYATDPGQGPQAFAFAALEHHMVRNEAAYRGKEWTPYWDYAREAVGYLQQQLADNRFFSVFDSTIKPKHTYDVRLPETWTYITETRAEFDRFGKVAAGVLLPHTDLDRYTDAELARLGVDRSADTRQFAWVDLDNLFVTVRDGDTHLHASLVQRNNGFLGNGRLHAQYAGHEQLLQIATQGVFDSRGCTLRPSSAEDSIFYDRYGNPDGRPLAMAGEPIPVCFQPGVGHTNRDNNREDTPYSGYPDLITTRVGAYFIAANTTRGAYGNERPFEVSLPAGVDEDTVPDLVSGRRIRSRDGKVALDPGTAVVLKLPGDRVGDETPDAVDIVVPTPGSTSVGLTWRPVPGARSYTVSRSSKADGRYAVRKEGVKGTSYVDRTEAADATYYYRVTPVGDHGRGRPSAPVIARVTPAHSPALHGGPWRDDLLDGARGTTKATDTTITISGASGRGFGGGDDAVIYDRDHKDSLVFVSRPVQGSASVEARIGRTAGDVAGLMIRDSTGPHARYVYLGPGEDGALVLRERSLDSREDIKRYETRSPFTTRLKGHSPGSAPYLKLVRAADSHEVTALLSQDGKTWERVGRAQTPMPDVVHAGVAVTGDTAFDHVAVNELPRDAPTASVARAGSGVTVHWNKPKHAIAFTLYATTAGSARQRLFSEEFRLAYDHDAALGSTHYQVVAHHADGSSTALQPALEH